ncbi:type II toxin-antitoxin system RelE family toxin [Rhodopirellula baltica]|uniref:ParE-like toxin domain-containing protein n=1 Tax=Rhodopirellula baltica WH47 TaxID=991778 RepID=F2AQK7_RHOBT|nr:hypothetical protein RBWH47_01235 [Rhodopirellula baltica WH47]
MISFTTRRFRECFAALPRHIQKQTREAYRQFLANPSHPGLRFKPIVGQDNLWSARITLDYRALCVVEENTATWFWIGSHSDYDKLLSVS